MKTIGLSGFFVKKTRWQHTLFKSLLCAFVICFTLSMTEFDAQSREISQQVVRLHILANSDSAEDQRVKLLVRDRVQELCADISPKGCTKTEAERILRERLPQLVDEAKRVVREQGHDDDVSGELVNMYFTNRTYGSVTLPAGNYDALRLTVGSGKGHNWWCVMFPPMCIGASGADISDVLTDNQTALVESGQVEYKFKIYEIYEDLVSKRRDK